MRKKTTATNTGDGCRVKRRTSQEVGVMPKEIIATNPLPEGWQNQGPADGPQPAPWRLTVGWHGDGQDVQVGAGIDGTYEVGQFFHLDRGQVNRLIRTLRKARDAAFGSDA